MDRESNSATRHPVRAAVAIPRGDGRADARADARAANRLRGWAIAVGASLVLWGGILAVVWLVGTALD